MNGAAPELTLSFVVAPPPKIPSIRPFHFVYQNDAQIGRTTNCFQLFRYLEWQMHVFLNTLTQDYYLLHSGAVAMDGAGILLPGPSGSGKSSLTLALIGRGRRFLALIRWARSPSSVQ